MATPLRESVKQEITSAIAAGTAPRVPTRGRGVMLAIAGKCQGTRLMDEQGDLALAGEYYYEAMGVAPPDRRADYN